MNAVFLDGFLHHVFTHFALFGQSVQRGHSHMVAVYFEEAAQVGTAVGAAETVGAEYYIVAVFFRNVGADAVGKTADVVGSGDNRAGMTLQLLGNERQFLLGSRMQAVPTVSFDGFAVQQVE